MSPSPAPVVYVFLLGLASGVTLLAMSAYRRVSPTWLRPLLLLSGGCVLLRYLTLMLFTLEGAPDRFWPLRGCWFATSIGLTLPSVIAVDQLVRHPALTPQKLLQWYAPFFVGYLSVMLFATVTPSPDPVVGWTLHLGGGWRAFLGSVQAIFVLGFVAACVALIRKLPARPIRLALLGLVGGQLFLGLDGLLLMLGHWYFRPYLYSELVMLLALWHAYETSATAEC